MDGRLHRSKMGLTLHAGSFILISFYKNSLSVKQFGSRSNPTGPNCLQRLSTVGSKESYAQNISQRGLTELSLTGDLQS